MRNSFIRGSLGVADVKDKLQEHQLRWYGHVARRGEGTVVQRVLDMSMRLIRVGATKTVLVRRDTRECGVEVGLAQCRNE